MAGERKRTYRRLWTRNIYYLPTIQQPYPTNINQLSNTDLEYDNQFSSLSHWQRNMMLKIGLYGYNNHMKWMLLTYFTPYEQPSCYRGNK